MLAAGVKREEDLKVREKTLQSLRIKGAFTAQELYDGHRGEYFQEAIGRIYMYIVISWWGYNTFWMHVI